MEYLKALAELGVWLATYPLGAAVLAVCGRDAYRLRFHPLLAGAVGSAVATLAMMLLAQAGLFSPALIGLAGWIAIGAWCWRERIWTRRDEAKAQLRAALRGIGPFEAVVLAAIVAVAGALYAFYPKESLLGERDEGIYAQHALHLLLTGGSKVDIGELGLAGEASTKAILARDMPPLPGLYPTGTRWTLQFSAATPVWMATLAATLGPNGIFRFNAVLGALGCLAFFALVRRLLPASGRAWALPATTVFALQPASVWIGRNTLSEPLCVWFLLTGLLMATIAAARRSRALGLLAGALIGMCAFVRIDSVVFALAIAAAGLALNLLDRGRRHPGAAAALGDVASGCYAATALAIGYYLGFVQPYLIDLSELVLGAIVATVLCAFAASLSGRDARLRLSASASARLAWPAALAMAALFVYALWIRPHLQPYSLVESRLAPQLNGNRDYREISLTAVAGYLSWPVTLAAGLGATLLARATMLRRTGPIRTWLWAVLFVPTLVYLWKPMITPDHIWASRRWIPVVFPTCIALAAYAAARLTPRSRPSAQGASLGAIACTVALALGAQALWQQRDTLRLREDAGMVAQVAAMAERLPPDRTTYVIGSPALLSALLTAYGRPVAQPVPEQHDDPAKFCPPVGECWVLHPKGLAIALPGAQTVADLPLHRIRRATTFEPPAHGTYQDKGEWRLTRIAR